MATIEKRITDKGETSFRVKVRLKGHPSQTATFGRITDAKKWAGKVEAAIREGRYFKTVEAKRHTLSELIDRYTAHVLTHKSKSRTVIRNQESQLAWWKEKLGSYTLADISPALIAEQRDELASGMLKNGKRRSPATVNRYLAALSHAFTVAVKEWGWTEDNPARKVTRPREARGRVRFLSDKERQAFLKACRDSSNSHLYPVIALALSTGARHGEIMGLKWNDVDFSRGVITLHETKNGERRLLPLTGHALERMRAHAKVRRIDTDYVFPSQKGDQPANIRNAFDAAVEAAKLDDFRFHDLRHSAASYLAMNGASLAEIAEVLGHKTLQMVKRYAPLVEYNIEKVVSITNAKVFEEKR